MTDNIKYFISLLMGIIVLQVNAQKINFGLETGLGKYGMRDLKEISRDIITQLSFPARITSDYPVYLYYQPQIIFKFKSFNFGLLYSFHSTGSRISSKDYSGEYKYDTKINCHAPAIILGIIPYSPTRIKNAVLCEVGFVRSNLSMNESMRIGTESSSVGYEFVANSFFFEPKFQLSYPMKNNFTLGINIGYFKEFKRGDFKLKKDSQSIIPMDHDFIVENGWDGLRLGLSVSYSIHGSSE
jgi:hypothetical protein